MDIRIGVTDGPREITLRIDDDVDRDEVKARVDKALSGAEAVLWLTDHKGREIAVAASRIAYVDLAPEGSNPIGFS